MRMKCKILLMCFLVFGSAGILAQSDEGGQVFKGQKFISDRTLAQQFAKDVIPSAEERKKKREKTYERWIRIQSILDTSQIKPKRKQKLLHDLKHDPFSLRLRKFLEEHNVVIEKLSSNKLVGIQR